MAKSKVLKRAIELLQANKKSLADGSINDHAGLVTVNEVLLNILLEDSK